MNGIETCRKIKESPKYANVPILLLAANIEINERIEGLKAGASDFITRPIIDNLLFSRIKSLIRLKRVMEELVMRSDAGIGSADFSDSEVQKKISQSRVLIVDDDQVQLGIMNYAVKKITDNVININDFPFDIDVILEEKFDVIIISTLLLEEDGLRICAKIINNYKFKDVPVLVIVDQDDERVIAKALDIRVSDYLLTPLDEIESNVRIYSQIKRKILQDILKKNFEQNITLSSNDALTGLYNRNYFNIHAKAIITSALKNKSAVSLMILDLDHFKSVNDNYGHLVGDEVLKETAKRVLSNSSDTDLICRFGGEEFVIMLEKSDLAAAQIVAEKIRLAIQDAHFVVSHKVGKINKTVSIGVVEINIGKETVEEAIARADKCLYIAKDQGRNVVIVSSKD